MQFKRMIICVALAFTPGAFAAEVTEATLPTELSTIIVTAPRGIANSDEANLSSLRPSTSDTASLLRDIPGVSLYGAGGVSSLPVIHGMADDRVNVQVDGMGLMPACPNHMNSPLSYIDPTNVGTVKVFAGVTPVSVGGDSIGGTIQVNSTTPQFAQAGQGTLLNGQAGAFYRSNGNAYGANLAATIASEILSMTYSGSTAQSGDYKAAKDFKVAAQSGNAWLAGDVVGSTAYKSVNQELGFALRHENHLIELKVSEQNIPYEDFPNQRMDLTGNTDTNINLRYTGQYQWGKLEASAYNQTTNHSMNFGNDKQFWYGPSSTSTIVAPGMPMNADGKTTGALVKGDIVLSERDILRVGTEIQNYSLNDWWPSSPSSLAGFVSNGKPATAGGMAPNTFQNINNGSRDRVDVFGEWEARWNPQWLSQLGVRSDTVKMNTGNVQGYNTMMMNQLRDSTAFNALNHQITDHNWDLTALSRYTPDATHSFEAGYAQKTRSPNLYERYTWSTASMMAVMNNFVGDGNGYVGNLNLKPEVAHTLSATADWHDAAKEQWELKVTPYYTYVENYIDAQCLPGTTCKANQFNVLQYVNQSAKLYGIDVSGHLPLAKTGDYGSLTGTGVLSYTKGENQTTGDNLYNIMPLNTKLAVVQSMGSWTNTAEVQLVAAKTNVSQVRNEVQTGGYSLFNLRSSYEWKKARLDIGVDNLFNKFYSLPLGGAYVGQGMTMGINSIPWGVPVPGMGISIYTALNFKF
jgi:iron complex outermembrane receptor protein